MRLVLLVLFLAYRINYSLKVESTNDSYLNLDNFPSFSSFVDDILEKQFELGSERDISNDYYLKFSLAPSFGPSSNLVAQDYLMDGDLKDIIMNTTNAIEDIPKTQRDWETVISELNQNPQIQQVEKSLNFHYDTLNEKGSNLFDESGSPDEKIVKEILSWFSKFVDDSDIDSTTDTDICETIRTAAITSVQKKNFNEIFYNKKNGQSDVIVVGILRYPDYDNPYFKVYTLKLEAWFSILRHFFVTWYKNGISGEVRVTRYELKPLVLQNVQQQILEQLGPINKNENVQHKNNVRGLLIVLGSFFCGVFLCFFGCWCYCRWSSTTTDGNRIVIKNENYSTQIYQSNKYYNFDGKKTREPVVGVPLFP